MKIWGAAAIVLFLAFTPVASASSVSSNAATRRATSVLLTARDFGGGWSSGPGESTGPRPACVGGSPTPAAAGVAARDYAAHSGGPFANQIVYAYTTSKAAGAVWNRLMRRSFLGCLTRNLSQNSFGGLGFTVLDAGVLRQPVVNVENAGYEITAAATSGSQASPRLLYLDLLLLRRGPTLTTLSLVSLGAPPLASVETSLARIAASRLEDLDISTARKTAIPHVAPPRERTTAPNFTG